MNSDLVNNLETEYNQAILSFQKNDYNECEKKLKYVLEYLPDNSDVLNFYGRLKQFTNQFEESLELLNKAVKCDDNNFMAHYNLGLAYCIKKDLKNTKIHFEKYQKLNTKDESRFYCNLYLSKLHFDELDIEETKYYYNKSNIPLFQKLSVLLIPRVYESTEQINYYRKLYYDSLTNLYNDCSDIIINSNDLFNEYLQFIYCYGFPLSYQGKNNKKTLEMQCKLYRKIFPSLNYNSPYLNEIISRPKTKIKIGFISTNFFNQSVSRDRMGIIRNLPRQLFDVTVFFYFKPSDDLGNFIWNSENNNVVLPDSSFFERRKIIEEQKLDILVYCDIGMAPDTYFLAYSKLAPVQCNTWGHSDTSGIDTIDYYLSSIYYEKEQPQENYSEKVVLLESLCTFYYKIIEQPQISTKNYFAFSNNTNIYLSSQVLFKLNPDFDHIINDILTNDPNGVCIFIKMNLGSYIQDTIINRMENVLKHNMTRVHFIEWQKCERDFYKLLSIADVIIDPYPFGGCNTSFSAFSMGIPIVTMPADYINGRFTHGLYKKMGILDLVANNNKEYVQLANKCATDKIFRKSISDKIIKNLNLIFNEPESVNTWINFCVQVINNTIPKNSPIFISKEHITNENQSKITETTISNNIPKIIHFIHFGYTDFTFIHYYAIKTAYDNNKNYIINLYNYIKPNNIWFKLASNYITNIIYTIPPTEIFGNPIESFAHKADIIRLQKLIEHGGIYLDIDVWTNKSYDNLLENSKSCIMGYQCKNTQFEGLCNAVILAKPQSEFLQLWLANYKSFNKEQWDVHSVYLPLKLSESNSSLIDIKSQDFFFPFSWYDFDILFKKSNSDKLLTNSYCIHLWETHLYEPLLNKISPSYFNIYNTPLSNIFSKYLYNKNTLSLLFILQYNNLDYLQKSLLYIKDLITQGHNIYIKYINDNNHKFNNIDDNYILLNTLHQKQLDYSKLNHIIYYTDSIHWKKHDNITTYAFYNSIILNDLNDFNNIDIVLTSSHSEINTLKIITQNIKYINYPINNINSTINKNCDKLVDFYNSIETLYKKHNNTIIINKNLYIENNESHPLINVKKNKFIYYSFVENYDNIYSLIHFYNDFYNKYNYDNILLYIYCNHSNNITNFIEQYKNIEVNSPVIINFNNLCQDYINIIHQKSSVYLSIFNNSYSDFNCINSSLYNNQIILSNNNSTISEYIINLNLTDLNNIVDVMNYTYNNSNHESLQKNINNLNNFTLGNYKNIFNLDENKNNNFNCKNDNSDIKKEILMIGKFSEFKNRMDTMYYEILEYFKNNSNYTITLIDTIDCKKHETLDYYITKYCKTTNPIIYNIVYTNKSEQIISNLSETKLTTIYEIEDCYEVDLLISNINDFKYDYVIYRYNCEQLDYIKSKSPNTIFLHLPHYINTKIFNIDSTIPKKYDILLYGNISNFYPFRQRLFNLIINSGLNYYHLEHPGYNTTNAITKNQLSKLINQSKLTISTSSAFNYFLKKYLEISMSGSILAGNFPITEHNPYTNCMCLLDETMNDNTILSKLKAFINLSNSDYNNIIKASYEYTSNNLSYEKGLIKLDNIFDSITDNIIENNTENNKVFTHIYENKIWHKEGGSGDGSTIEFNKEEYIPFITKFIETHHINSVVDLGCGDWQSSYLIYDNLNINYIGYDVYENIININNKKFPRYTFKHLDFIENKHVLKYADLCIIKDVLQHLPTKNIYEFLDYIIEKKIYKYILITNCCEQLNDDDDIKPGEWRQLSALKFPLKKYNPTILLNYNTKQVSLITV